MKGYKWFSEFISLLGNISSVASCVLAGIGVTNIVYLTNETKEIVKEIKVEKEFIPEYIHDTIFIEKEVIVKDIKPIPTPSKKLDVSNERNIVSDNEKKEIRRNENNFRDKHGIESPLDQYRF